MKTFEKLHLVKEMIAQLVFARSQLFHKTL